MTTLWHKNMDSTNQLKLQSVLVALVNLPANEEAPPLEKDLLTNPHNTIISLKDSGGHQKFLQLYENAYQQFLSRYSSQEKNKIVKPKGTAADASAERNNEDGNTAVSVDPEKLLKTWDVTAILGDNHPAATARAAYEARSNGDMDVYIWAEYSCQIC